MNNTRGADAGGIAIDRERMLGVALALMEAPSPTGSAGAACDALADLLAAHGVACERHDAGHAPAPAVVAWLRSGVPGPTLQFNGHLDIVHLPFVPPCVAGGLLRGSGAADMKGGTAAAVEAFLALRDAGLPRRGSLLLTAHDLHEAPWGFGTQLENLIKAGIVGDAVLLPEPLCDRLPVSGRGQACWLVRARRAGPPTHEVMHPADEPYVLDAMASMLARLRSLDDELNSEADPVAGRSSVFVGQAHSGELYNQSAQEFWLEGTRRWIPSVDRGDVERQFRDVIVQVARECHVQAEVDFRLIRDAFRLDETSALVMAFQRALRHCGSPPLPTGAKPFVDDGNAFWASKQIAAITHGPKAGGQHTTDEWADIDDMVRVARVYAETAIEYLETEG